MMKNESIQLLKNLILEVRAEIGDEYKKKENIRKSIQDLLQSSIASGEVATKEDLAKWWETFDMATNALRMVPADTWKMMSNK